MSTLPQTAIRRNALDGLPPQNINHPEHRNDVALTPGGREIYRRMHWSPSLCNAVASMAGFTEASN